jgi:hypothetical protein
VGRQYEMTGIRVVAKGGICMSILKDAGKKIPSKRLVTI